MRAHALCARLIEDITFPFLTLLISGGHSILAVATGPTEFDIIGLGDGCSPGECLDKVARQIGIKSEQMHFGAEVEKLAESASVEDCLKYTVKAPVSQGADFNFESIKGSFINMVKYNLQLPLSEQHLSAFCASLQVRLSFQQYFI